MIRSVRLKDEEDPRSLYEPADDEHDMLVDTIDEETNDIFFAREVYVQLVEFPKDDETVPQVIIKTETLNDFALPFSQKTYLGIRTEPFFAETVREVFDFPLRVVSLHVHDMDERPYVLQIALSLQDVHTTLQDLLVIFAVLFPALLMILSVLGYVFMKRAFLPVKQKIVEVHGGHISVQSTVGKGTTFRVSLPCLA